VNLSLTYVWGGEYMHFWCTSDHFASMVEIKVLLKVNTTIVLNVTLA
jgi:hypothetical protein